MTHLKNFAKNSLAEIFCMSSRMLFYNVIQAMLKDIHDSAW